MSSGPKMEGPGGTPYYDPAQDWDGDGKLGSSDGFFKATPPWLKQTGQAIDMAQDYFGGQNQAPVSAQGFEYFQPSAAAAMTPTTGGDPARMQVMGGVPVGRLPRWYLESLARQ